MNLTYNQILNEMKDAYEGECSEMLEKGSDTEKRLEAVASELFALSCYGDFIFKQAFVQTATGEYLDRLGELRDIYRKKESRASGKLIFYIEEPAVNEIIIPEGTMCSVENKPYQQYATIKQAAIPIGNTEVTVDAVSIEDGSVYNAMPDEITVMVNAPVGVVGVYNSEEFRGGCDRENDTALRNRILRNYSVLSNGINAISLESIIMKCENVIDCSVTSAVSTGFMNVYLRTRDNTLTNSMITEVRQRMAINTIKGAQAAVYLAGYYSYVLKISLEITLGYGKEKAVKEICEPIREFCNAVRIGEVIWLSDIEKIIRSFEFVKNFTLTSSYMLGDKIPCNSKKYLKLENILVDCYEEYTVL